MANEAMTWNLDDILYADKFDDLCSDIERDLKKLDRLYGKLHPRMPKKYFKKVMDFYDDLTEKCDKIDLMPKLELSSNQKSEKARLLKSRADTLLLKCSEESLKIDYWIKGKRKKKAQRLDSKNAKRLFNSVPSIRYVLNDLRKSSLNESEEKIIMNKDSTGAEVLKDLRTVMETELDFFFKPKGKKRGKIMKSSEIDSYKFSSDKDERESAYRSSFKEYSKNLDKFFMIYEAIVKNWVHECKLRGHEFPISMRNYDEDIPGEVVKNLLDTCAENAFVYRDYFKFKARELGEKKLSRFDLYAPFKKNIQEKNIPFKKAIDLVLESFEEFSPEFAEKAKKIIDERHIDSHPRLGKVFGAFCQTISPRITPYVLLNYEGKWKDVSTLAHELGHGVHSLYADHHSIRSQLASTSLCETASTLGEVIVFEKLLEKAESDEAKKKMLSEKMGESYATILRQSYFTLFEIKAHEAIKKGVNASELSDIYLDTLKEQFKNSIVMDDCFKHEWACIPHFVDAPFDCYSYAFGELLSLALYSEYKKQGKSFVPKIEKILSYGGSENPQKILEEAGFDICSKKFWNEGFKVVRGWQKQLEECSKK